MRIGLQISDFNWPRSQANIGGKLTEIAKTADEIGVYSLWVPDHFFNAMSVFGFPVEAPILEGYSTISYMTAVTRRIKLGLLVTCNFFRHPGFLVKSVSTLDVLSGGRAYLGIGAGWFEREAKGLGIPFPSLSERFERLEETLQIAKQMWAGIVQPFEGKYYQLVEPLNSPQPLSKPHPPILIGGSGEKKTLRFVAKYGNACNFFIGSPLKELPASFKERYKNRIGFLRTKLATLKQHCANIGRSYADIEKTVHIFVKLTTDTQSAIEVIDLCRELAGLGFHHVIFNMPNVHEIKPIEILGQEVIPAVSDL